MAQQLGENVEIYKEQIPPETLVLSFFNKLKLKTTVFKDIYSGIMDTLVVPTDFCEDTRILEAFLPEVIDKEKEKLLEFLKAIDTGIKNINYDDSEKEIDFVTYHTGKDGEEYPLNLYCESEGTIKSIMLFIYAQTAILNNRSIFVDELNVKLHPLLLKFIIDLFYDENSMAQLIYTTHDTTLMDKKFLGETRFGLFKRMNSDIQSCHHYLILRLGRMLPLRKTIWQGFMEVFLY